MTSWLRPLKIACDNYACDSGWPVELSIQPDRTPDVDGNRVGRRPPNGLIDADPIGGGKA